MSGMIESRKGRREMPPLNASPELDSQPGVENENEGFTDDQQEPTDADPANSQEENAAFL